MLLLTACEALGAQGEKMEKGSMNPFNVEGYYYPSTEFVASGKAHSMEKYIKNMEKKSWDTIRSLAKEPYDNDAVSPIQNIYRVLKQETLCT